MLLRNRVDVNCCIDRRAAAAQRIAPPARAFDLTIRFGRQRERNPEESMPDVAARSSLFVVQQHDEVKKRKEKPRVSTPAVGLLTPHL